MMVMARSRIEERVLNYDRYYIRMTEEWRKKFKLIPWESDPDPLDP
jgi:hypothetical protein